jgi:hypothetical protein
MMDIHYDTFHAFAKFCVRTASLLALFIVCYFACGVWCGEPVLWRVGVAVLDFRFFRDVLFNFEYEVREV